MARKSRRYISNLLPAECACAEDLEKQVSWRVALYARLSVEDARKKQAGSMENQLELLRLHAQGQTGWEIVAEYADCGYTGTHFQRPGFLQMLAEIEAGRINCIVVKDLSRFGRNHREAGYYLEQLFPARGVRFIALGENIDSLNRDRMGAGIELPARNLINELYARDISRKVTVRFAAEMRCGKFLGSMAAYGYRRATADGHRLEVDERAARVVTQIFYWRAQGLSHREIARALTQARIPPPSAMRGKLGGDIWHQSTVGRILKNLVYIGCMAQGKQKNIPLSGKRRTVPPPEWIIVSSTHPAIIEQALFELVNRKEVRDESEGSTL